MGVVALWVLMGTKRREDESCRNTKSRTPNVTDQKPQIGHGQILSLPLFHHVYRYFYQRRRNGRGNPVSPTVQLEVVLAVPCNQIMQKRTPSLRHSQLRPRKYGKTF